MSRGGKRPGSGRKKGEPTVTLAFRVPQKGSDELKTALKEVIAQFIRK